MPANSRQDMPIVGGMGEQYSFRNVAWGDMSVAFDTFPAGDLGPLLKGLPDDRCQCPHWGFLFKGRIVVRYANREEVIEAGQAFYMAPGHVPEALEDCEILQFSPAEAMHELEAVMARNMAAGARPMPSVKS